MFFTLSKDASDRWNIYYFNYLTLEKKGHNEFLDEICAAFCHTLAIE